MQQALAYQEVPLAAIQTSLASVQASTLQTYSPAIRRWEKFARQNNLPIFAPSVSELLLFFQSEFDAGRGGSTLNCSRAAIGLLVTPKIMEDTRIKRFFAGISRLRPTGPKYAVTWDPAMVFNFLRTLPANNVLSVIQLSRKTIVLLALASGHRVQTFSLIEVGNIVEFPDRVEITITARIKTSRFKGPLQKLILPFFVADTRICPARTLLHYIQRTATFRGNFSQLFLTATNPIKPASTSTLGRWIKEVLRDSGVDNVFTAHSTRHAATSAASRKGVPIETIRQAAGWSKQSNVFARFYKREIIEDAAIFANSILSS